MKENNIASNKNIKGKILPGVSFITTVYNEEKDITEFLESLMGQTYLPGEIIIVDGGSVDLTFNKILDFFDINIAKDDDEKIKAEESYSSRSDVKPVKSGNIQQDLEPVEGDCAQPGAKSVKSSSVQSNVRDVKTVIKGADCGPGNTGNINIRIIKKDRANISQGRNEAIKNSSGGIICVSDAGCILDSNWLFEITRFYNDDLYNVVGGLNLPCCKSFLQKCLAACIMPSKEEIKDERFMPSSRNISFKKKVWAEAGGYPESMDYGEDMKFNFNIKNNGYNIKFNPDAIVYWKMRENPVQISRQFFRYAKGDAIGRMYPHRHLIRFIAFLLIIAIISCAFYISKWVLLALVPLFIIYTFKPYRRLACLFRSKSNGKCCFYGKEKILSILFIPLLLLQIDISKMCGYINGLIQNIRSVN